MAVTAKWLNESNEVLHFEYKDKWTWDEAVEAIQKSQTMLNEVQHPVSSIIELEEQYYLPPNPMKYLKQIVENRSTHKNDSGITIFLNAEVLTKAMLDVISIGNPEVAKFVTFNHAKTVHEAIEKIQAIQESQ